jgi:ribosomal-protein-alanine N-acetyltransferase
MTSISINVPGSPASIVPATWRDLKDLRRVERACFLIDSWPLLDIITVLTMPGIVRLKADIDGELIGFIAGDVRKSERLAWIATFCVLPQHRNKGIGSSLLSVWEGKVKVHCIRLSVRISNQTAVDLYRHAGYQKVGLWKAYYQNGEDALVMEKELL